MTETIKKDRKYGKVLNIPINSTSMTSVLEKIDQKCQTGIKNSRPFFIITAYSESFLESEKNIGFKKAVEKADLVVGDGVSVFAAMDYLAKPKVNLVVDFFRGLGIGLKILRGEYRDRVVGVELFKRVLEARKYKIFLLGGWGGVAGRLAAKYKCAYDEGPLDLREMKENENGKLLAKINGSQPDLLFVGLGRFKQEVWIAKNLQELKCKVVIGVGSAFDEVDEGWGVPAWVSKAGLKWLWRGLRDPKHIVRAWRAFPVFAWKVFWTYEFK